MKTLSILLLTLFIGCSEKNDLSYLVKENGILTSNNEDLIKGNINLKEQLSYQYGRYVTSQYYVLFDRFPNSRFMDSAFKYMPDITKDDFYRIENSISK